MSADLETPENDVIVGHALLRCLVVVYLVALTFGAIDGAMIPFLFYGSMTPVWAQVFTGFLAMSLSVMFLTGHFRRPAALILAVLLFWSVYIPVFAHDADLALATFWREIAIIGALIYSYADRNNSTQNDLLVIGGVYKRILTAPTQPAKKQRPEGEKRRKSKRTTSQFQRDFEVARPS